MSDAPDAAADLVPAKNKSKILPLMLVINTLLLTGVLVFVMKRPSAQAAGGKDEHGDKAKAEHGESGEKAEKGKSEKGEGGEHAAEGERADTDGVGPTLRLDAFIVQVRSAEGDRYAHITIEVEVGSEGDKKAIESRMPRIRDAIIAYLSDRTEDELRGSEGLGQMKVALGKKLDELVPGHRIRGLFTTEFIIQ